MNKNIRLLIGAMIIIAAAALFFIVNDSNLSAEMGILKWPGSDIAHLLPVPESEVGMIEKDGVFELVIHVGNTTKSSFNAYVKKCEEMGFSLDCKKGNGYYYANHAGGFHLELEYKENHIMSVMIKKMNHFHSYDMLLVRGSPAQEKMGLSIYKTGDRNDKSKIRTMPK